MKRLRDSFPWRACMLALAGTAPVLPVSAASAPAQATASTEAAQGAAAIVGAFHAALRENRRQDVLDLLAPTLAVFEQGYTESSRDAYADGHLDADLKFAATTQYSVVHREAYAQGDLAWVITQARTNGSFAGQPVDIDNTETMILQRLQSRWQIIHIHWSAHPRGE